MAERILIVRTSSLGDLIHMLPAMTDIAQHLPNATIDWVAEESFAEIPAWHPAVTNVIRVAHRRWRKSWWSAQARSERHALRERLRQTRYDVILDMQALLKSAWLVRQAKGIRHGLDWHSAREPLASLFYDVRHKVEFWQPAVIRQRALAGLAFGYTPTGKPDFGLQQFSRQGTAIGNAGGDKGSALSEYAIIMPSASRPDKLWPEADWQAVLERLRAARCRLLLLAGNDEERRRAQQLISGMGGAEVVPRMNLTSIARLMAGARLMVGLDSGLTHLSAALGRPTVGIYRASTPVRTPLVGDSYTASLGDRGASPSRDAVLAAVEQALAA